MTQIRLEAQVNSNVVTYEVVIEAPNPDLKLMPGLTANISIYVLKIDGVLLLPAKALHYRTDAKGHGTSEEGVHRIWVLENGKPQPKRITLGANDGIHYQVTEGLKQGDKVVVGESASAGTATEASSDNNAKQSPFMPGPPGSKKK